MDAASRRVRLPLEEAAGTPLPLEFPGFESSTLTLLRSHSCAFRLVSLIVLLTLSCLCHADSSPKGVKVERNIEYVPGGDPAQQLDLYLPAQPADKPLPLIVYIHGGGWHGGSKAGSPATGFVAHGYAAASVEYRFSQKALFPAQIQDCQAAIRWLRANSRKYNLDPDHIGVWGGSAGGHLVALLGTAGGKKAFPPIGGNEDQSDRVQAVCDEYGPADFNTVMRQAADDKNVRNIFKFNTPGDPYSDLIGASRRRQAKRRCRQPNPLCVGG